MKPEQEMFSVRQIVESIDNDPAAALMLFTIPSLVPVPGSADLTGPSTVALSASLVGNRSAVRLPDAVLGRMVSRRALALAIHAAVPVLARLEAMTRQRWSWLCTPAARRVIGVLVFLLALPLAFPILGFGIPHAASLFSIALGLMENDGAAVALGVTAGLASLVFITARNLSPAALIAKVVQGVNRFITQFASARAIATMLVKRCWKWFVATAMRAPETKPSRQPAVRTTDPARRLALALRREMHGVLAKDAVAV